MEILELMYQRMWQLNGRIIEIKNYVERDGDVISKKDYSLNDIPKLKNQIEQMVVAIKAIENFRSKVKKSNKTKASK